MYKQVLVSLCLLVTVLAPSVFAHDINLGVLDEQAVMINSKRIKLIVAKLHRQFAAQYKALKRNYRKSQTMITKYNKDHDKMDLAELKIRGHEADNQQRMVRRQQAVFSQSFLAAKDFEIEKLIEQLKIIVTKIAGRKKIDVVFFKDVIVYNKPKLDITKEVTISVKYNIKAG